MPDARDLAIEMLAADVAQLEQSRDALMDLVADLLWENFQLRQLFHCELKVIVDHWRPAWLNDRARTMSSP